MFQVNITTTRLLSSNEYLAFFCVSTSGENDIDQGNKGLASGMWKSTANEPYTTLSNTVVVTVKNGKVTQDKTNGWDLTHATVWVDKTNKIYTITQYTLNNYENMGLSQSSSGYVKCYCSDIKTSNELFQQQVDISKWNTGPAK